MNEIYNELDALKNNLDKLDVFKEFNNKISNIKKNNELIDKIKKYNSNYDDNLRKDIYSYKEIKEYKEIENNINLIILGINSKLKTISNSRSCKHESN